MTSVNLQVVAALFISTLCSLVYLSLALYQLFEIAQQDKLMFLLLVSFTVEVIFWCGYLGWMSCKFTADSRWHLRRITLPLWDLVFVMGLSILGMQLQQIDGNVWWQFSEQSLYAKITSITVLAVVPLKLISAVVLTEYFHRGCVKDGIFPSLAYEQSMPLTAMIPPNAPLDEDKSY